MKQILLLVGCSIGLFCAAVLFADNNGQRQEDYDEDVNGPKEAIIWVKPVRTVAFKHQDHVVDGGIDCDSCHDNLFEMEAGLAEENKDFTMASLYKGKYCGACHDGVTAFSSATRCATCHIGVLGQDRLLRKSKTATENQ